MKKIVAAFGLVLVSCSIAMAGQGSTSVGPAPVLLVPAPTVQATNTYAWSQSNTFVTGASVFLGSATYVTPYGGASTGVVAPSATSPGDITGPDGLLWRPVLGKNRTGLIISNSGTNKVYLGVISNTTGVAVMPSTTVTLDECSQLQNALWCIGTAGSTSTVSVLEY